MLTAEMAHLLHRLVWTQSANHWQSIVVVALAYSLAAREIEQHHPLHRVVGSCGRLGRDKEMHRLHHRLADKLSHQDGLFLFQLLEQRDLRTGQVTPIDMPARSNVLQYYTEDNTKVSIRPSGTEPKIKFYIEVHDKLDKAENYDAKNEWADQKIDRICRDLGI